MAQAEVDEKRENLKRKAKSNRVHLFRGLVSMSTCFYCGKPLPLLGLIVGESQELLVFQQHWISFYVCGKTPLQVLRNKLHPELVRFVNCRSLQCLLSAQWVMVCREKLKGLCVRWQVHSHLLLLGMLRKNLLPEVSVGCMCRESVWRSSVHHIYSKGLTYYTNFLCNLFKTNTLQKVNVKNCIGQYHAS